jgi:hypothetical protein
MERKATPSDIAEVQRQIQIVSSCPNLTLVTGEGAKSYCDHPGCPWPEKLCKWQKAAEEKYESKP